MFITPLAQRKRALKELPALVGGPVPPDIGERPLSRLAGLPSPISLSNGIAWTLRSVTHITSRLPVLVLVAETSFSVLTLSVYTITPQAVPNMSNNKWFMNSIDQQLTATGYKIVIQTDIACHLWMRWTTIVPQEHLIQRTKRGLPLMLEKYYCFDVYEDNEQEEAGDTLEHTFIKEPWASCETRYFYFHGEISGTPSPSTTAIFKKHRLAPPPAPITADFYPDLHPELTSVDGGVGHLQTLTFMQLRAASGSLSNDTSLSWWAYFRASSTANKWRDLRRVIYLYDTSSIPVGSTIQSATLTISMSSQVDDTGNLPSLCVVSSSPTSNTQLFNGDYDSLGAVALSEIKEWAELVGVVETTFTLNALGLVAVIAGGITKLGMREAKFDMPGVQPNWGSGHATGFNLFMVEKGGDFRPKLTVTYLEP